MNFIIDNYLWFGIAGVVLLMALIGFLAEKTNFIVGSSDTLKKPKKKKKSKKEIANEFMETEEIVEEPENNTAIMDDTTTIISDAPVEDESENNLNTSNEEVLNFSAIGTEPSIEAAPLNIDDTWSQPGEAAVVTETGEDLSQPFGESIQVPGSSAVEEQTDTNAIDEDIWKF